MYVVTWSEAYQQQQQQDRKQDRRKVWKYGRQLDDQNPWEEKGLLLLRPKQIPQKYGGGGKFTPGPVPTALQKGMYSVFLCVSIITIANIIG